MKQYLKTLALLLLVTPALQAAEFEIPLQLNPFPQSQLISSEQRQEPDYRLMLSGIMKINGRIRTDRDQRLQASLSRMTWQLPDGYDPQSGFSFLRAQLDDRGAQVMFECSGRQCGPSSIWANDVFDQSRLYGIDNTQFYAAMRLDQAHVALYAVRRGNGRVFLHMDVLENESQTISDPVAVLAQQGYVELQNWPESSDRTVASLLDMMQGMPGQELWLVVHWQGQDLELTLRQSQEAADRLLRQVVEKGGDVRQLKARGVGSLVPSVLGSRRQVAIVVMRRGSGR